MSNDGKLTFIAELKERVNADLARMRQSVANTKSSFQSAFAGIRGYVGAAFGVGAIVGFARSLLDYVGKIKDASEATGLSTTHFQALSITARKNGIEMAQLSMSLGRLQKIQGSIGDDQRMQETFRKLGISVSEIQTLGPDRLLQRIASGIRSTGDASVAFDIFGESASRMLSTLNELADGWDSMVAKTRGGIISEDDIERIDRMGDVMDDASTKGMAWGAQAVTTYSDIVGWIGKLSNGLGPLEAIQEQVDDLNQRNADRAKEKRDADSAKARAAKLAEERKSADALNAARKQGSSLGEQWQKVNLTDKQMEVVLQSQVNDLVAAANEQGISDLERQVRHNSALEKSIQLLEVQKKIKSAADAEEESRTKANESANAEASTIMRKNAYDKLSPEDQLKATESNLKRLQAQKNAGGITPEVRRDLIKQIDAEDRERTRLQGQITGDRASRIKDAQTNLAMASERRVAGDDLAGYFQRVSDLSAGRVPRDDAAAQTAENTRIIAENTKALQDLGVARP